MDVPENGLAEGMKRLNWRCASALNKRYGRRGHWVGGKYLSVAVVDDPQLLVLYRYIVRNPVEAKLCANPAEWPHSSYAATIGVAEGFSFVDPSIVLGQFGAPSPTAIERLRGFVEMPWR